MNSFSSLRVQGDRNYTNEESSPTSVRAILNSLRLVVGDTSLVSNFSQVWTVHKFQLGDELINYSADREAEDTGSSLYLVCQGRVRLLGLDVCVKRSVSTQLLLVPQTFGADHLFCNQPLPYRAIAASDGFLAQIKISDLMPWLQQLLNLHHDLKRTIHERQTLIFFKTCTELRSMKSDRLRQLLPYLEQKKIAAGSLLEAIPPTKGRFWLKSGKINTQDSQVQPPMVGDSWGDFIVKPLGWSAETDLLLYHISVENWDLAVAIVPELSETITDVNFSSVPLVPRQSLGMLSVEAQPPNNLVEAEPHLLHSQAEPHLLHSQAEPHLLHSQAEPHLLHSQAEPHLLHSQAEPGNEKLPHCPTAPLPPSPPLPWLWRRYPFVQQQSSSDCGAACLAMISRYWGKRIGLNTLRNLTQTDRMGASLSALSDAAEHLGYEALSVRASMSKLELQTNPWIAHWQGGIHYVVVWFVKGDRVFISDPAYGKRSLTRQEFEENWTEYALCLSPTERLQALKDEKISLSGVWQALLPLRHLLGQIILVSVLLSTFGIAMPLFAQVVLDQAIPQKSLATLNVFAICLLLLGMGRIVLLGVRQYLLDYFSNLADSTLIGNFISHTLQLPLQFFVSRQVGDIISRVQENQKIQLFLTRQTITTALDTLIAVVYLGLMVYYNGQLTLIVLCLIALVVIFTSVASSFLKIISREFLNKQAGQNTMLVEIVTGIATVKATVSEQEVRLRWQERFSNMLKARFDSQKLANILQSANSCIYHLGNTAVLWYGATLVIRGSMTVGQFVAFNMLIGNAIKPVFAIVEFWNEFQEVLISVERLNDVLTTQPEENQETLLVLPPIRGDVRFENVTFRFNQYERNTLQNISFSVKAGQTIAIVGCSGSGKSTLMNLLAGLYCPQSGRILIDGHDIAHVSPQSLRSQLGVVPQECFLFSGTVLENITLYNSGCSLEQAIAAAKIADAHSFIETLPLGYHSQVGSLGMMLSGGQRQKIAIARALVRNSKILIFDEATSSLDAESEHRFLLNLTRLNRISVTSSRQACTIFMIAHRFSTVRHADFILVLNQGLLVEQGTHDELMTMDGLYYNLIQRQLHI